jgi:hypothetical protein
MSHTTTTTTAAAAAAAAAAIPHVSYFTGIEACHLYQSTVYQL